MSFQAKFVQEGEAIDYTPDADVDAGEVVNVGTIPMVARYDIEDGELGALCKGGVYDVVKNDSTFTAGDAVYWNSTGDPEDGTAGSGAATSSASGANLMGIAVEDAATGDTTVRVLLTAAKRTTTIAGSVTADDITGSDASLGITGLAGADGGAGGAVPIAGGDGDGAGAGGAAGVTGGPGGDTNADGGAVNLTGGTGGDTNGDGGAATVAGGAGAGTGDGGTTVITSGESEGTSGTAGAVEIDTGAANGGTGAGIKIAETNATDVTFGKMPRIPTATVAADGSANTDAAAVTEGFTLVTAADGTKGVILPSAVAGMQCILKNAESSNLKVYPGASDKINGGTATTGSLTLAADTSCLLVAYDTTDWYSVPLLPS